MSAERPSPLWPLVALLAGATLGIGAYVLLERRDGPTAPAGQVADLNRKLAALEARLAEAEARAQRAPAPPPGPDPTDAKLDTLIAQLARMNPQAADPQAKETAAALEALGAQTKAQAAQIAALTASLAAAQQAQQAPPAHPPVAAAPTAAALPPPTSAAQTPAPAPTPQPTTPAAVTPAPPPLPSLTAREQAYKRAWDKQQVVEFGGGTDQNGQRIPPQHLDPAAAKSLGLASWREWYQMDEDTRRRELVRQREEKEAEDQVKLQGLPGTGG